MLAQSPTISQRLGAYVAGLRFEDIPAEIVEKAKDHLANHIALAFGGHARSEGRAAVGFAYGLSAGGGQSTILGAHRPAMLLDAVIANACLIAAHHMDDTVEPAGLHPGVVVFPAVLAVGEARLVSGRELLAATVVGYDMSKLGDPVAKLTTYARRPQYNLAAFCAAASVGRLLGLPADRMAHAVGLAAHAGQGVVEGSEHAWEVQGLLSRSGTTVALAAEAGFEAAANIIEGPHGFYRAFYGDTPPELDGHLDSLGQDFALANATTKLYTASAVNIPAMQAALELRTSGAFTPGDVAQVVVALSDQRQGRDAHYEGMIDGPYATPANAQYSLRFRIAAILLDGCIETERAEEFRSPQVQDMLAKVRLAYEPGHVRRFGRIELPNSVYGRVEITLRDGRRLVAERQSFQPLRGDWDAWMRQDGAALLPEASLARIVELITRLEEVDDVAELLQAARAPQDRYPSA